MKRPRPRPYLVPRPGGDFFELVDIHARLMDRKSIEAPEHLALLLRVVEELLQGLDPRAGIFKARARPKNRHYVYVALDLELQRDLQNTPKKAVARVAQAWRLDEETVRAIARKMRGALRKQFEAQLEFDGRTDEGRIRESVELQRARWLDARRTI